MRKEILFSFVLLVLLQFHTAFSLECYSCDYICMNRQIMTCQGNQACATRIKKLGGINYRKLGCVNTTDCNKDVSEVELGTTVSIHNTCCDGELCNYNSATTAKLPFITAIGAVLVLWLSKQF